jgi:hypothetical protein
MNTGEVECVDCLSKNSDNEIKWDIRILHFTVSKILLCISNFN